MKRIHRLFVASILSFLLAACGGGDGGSDPADIRTEPDAGSADLVIDTGPAGDLAAPDSSTPDTTDTAEDSPPDTSDEPPPVPETAGVLMSLQEDYAYAPFPWDWYTVDDETTPTGLRLSFEGEARTNYLIQPVIGMFTKYLTNAAFQDGFGSAGIIVLPVRTPMGGGNLPAVTGPDLPLEVWRLGEDPASVPFRAEYIEYEDKEGQVIRRILDLDPIHPMRERTSYLVLVKRSLTDDAGAGLTPYPLSEVVLGLRDPYGPPSWQEAQVRMRDHTLAALESIPDGPDPEELAAAILVTVGSITDLFLRAAAELENQEVEYDLDPDGDGKLNVMPATEHAGFSSLGPAALFVSGRFKAPDFRNDDNYIFDGPSGHPEVLRYEWRDFYLVIPGTEHQPPFPMAIAQHGLSSWKETMFSMVKDYAHKGVAVGSFDFMYHAAGEEGGLKFMSVEDPRKLVEHFRQSALDIISFEKALRAIAENEDLYPLGGDDQPDFVLDRIVYSGHSLGSIISSIALVGTPSDRVGGLVNGGGDYIHILQTSFTKLGLYDMMPKATWCGFRALAGHLISPGDPAAYAPLLLHDPGPNGPVPVLSIVNLQDSTVPARCGYEHAVAARLPLLEPFIETWDFLETLTATDDTLSGVVQFEGEHNMFFSGPEPGKSQARALFYTYTTAFLETGTPTITWPQE